MYKSRLCRNWLQWGSCRYAECCQFAHGAWRTRTRGRGRGARGDGEAGDGRRASGEPPPHLPTPRTPSFPHPPPSPRAPLAPHAPASPAHPLPQLPRNAAGESELRRPAPPPSGYERRFAPGDAPGGGPPGLYGDEFDRGSAASMGSRDSASDAITMPGSDAGGISSGIGGGIGGGVGVGVGVGMPPSAPGVGRVDVGGPGSVGSLHVASGRASLVPEGQRQAEASARPKTRLCIHFERGSCTYGNRCAFAHGVSELATDPQTNMPPRLHGGDWRCTACQHVNVAARELCSRCAAHRRFVEAPPPVGYLCRLCGVPGHWIHSCPKQLDPRESRSAQPQNGQQPPPQQQQAAGPNGLPAQQRPPAAAPGLGMPQGPQGLQAAQLPRGGPLPLPPRAPAPQQQPGPAGYDYGGGYPAGLQAAQAGVAGPAAAAAAALNGMPRGVGPAQGSPLTNALHGAPGVPLGPSIPQPAAVERLHALCGVERLLCAQALHECNGDVRAAAEKLLCADPTARGGGGGGGGGGAAGDPSAAAAAALAAANGLGRNGGGPPGVGPILGLSTEAEQAQVLYGSAQQLQQAQLQQQQQQQLALQQAQQMQVRHAAAPITSRAHPPPQRAAPRRHQPHLTTGPG